MIDEESEKRRNERKKEKEEWNQQNLISEYDTFRSVRKRVEMRKCFLCNFVIASIAMSSIVHLQWQQQRRQRWRQKIKYIKKNIYNNVDGIFFFIFLIQGFTTTTKK